MSGEPTPASRLLYDPADERDSCGFGLIAQLSDQPSNDLVKRSLDALKRLTHRGAIAADRKTGDGCGLLIRRPEKYLRAVAKEAGLKLARRFAAGMLFLDRSKEVAHAQRECLRTLLEAEGLSVAGFRTVPVSSGECGPNALASLPRIEQIFVDAPPGMKAAHFSRRLFVARRRAEQDLDERNFYVASLSPDSICFKAMVMPPVFDRFFPDLARADLESSACVFHQRFSTNTTPQWRLAQPFRLLAHNGEINTIQGNRNWAKARSSINRSPLVPELQEFTPPVSETGSDSCSLDNMLELLLAGGLDLLHAVRILLPPAWQNDYGMHLDARAFYEFFSLHMEPWDGPAGIVMTDNRYASCSLDRNGLRPARYLLTDDGRLVVASETGVYDCAASEIVEKGRLGPGQMIAADLKTGRLLRTADIDGELMGRYPCKTWLKEGFRFLDSELVELSIAAEPMDKDTLASYEKMFNITSEEKNSVIRILAETQMEAVGSMGDDTPMPPLSRQVRPLFDYFRQQFAQVTNPPIDSLREHYVMSLQTTISGEANVFMPSAEQAKCISMSSPVLSQRKLRQIMHGTQFGIRSELIDLNYPENTGLAEALDDLCRRATDAVRAGTHVLLLSDRYLKQGKLPVHALLATGAVHQHLVRTGLRCRCSILVETGCARDPHHFACLVGNGATAVYPYMVYQILSRMSRTGAIGAGENPMTLGRAFRRGIRKGLFKIMSKMGISTVSSYRGAQLFEVVGLSDEVVDLCFAGTASRVQGANFDDLWQDQKVLGQAAWNTQEQPGQGGLLKYVHGGEYHCFNPDVVATLQAAVRSGDYDAYQHFAELVNRRPVAVMRDLMELVTEGDPVPLEEVEPIEDILPRFDTAGMSLGALSPEAHEALAIAMNRLGGRSNSGEGGESPARTGTERRSKIRQIASGRFGVTAEYLVNAEVIQIKIAQGAKPGEGGQLPGHKVNRMIADLRYASPGVGLISPPPHHDIYSIEDLAQLIYDLKQVNPDALVSVKLVAEPGVGTIAAGVTKAYADLITISGYDGGTGASPLTSVRYAGSPMELGVAETQQALRANGLRGRVRVQADGGLKTGLDVIKAAILGAESFGFGTAPMVALGCKYLRVCHLNNCATGVATQNDVLRSRHFTGLPEMVINYFRFVAEETRGILASLGVRRLANLIGRTEFLRTLPGETPRQGRLDLSRLVADDGLGDTVERHSTGERNPPFDTGRLSTRIVSEVGPSVRELRGGEFSFRIQNSDRAIGGRLSGEVARLHGNQGMRDSPVKLNFAGSAGQSFGCWNVGGLKLRLTGDANDYVGKGMTGGEIVLRPPRGSKFIARNTPIMGNTCLYGATGGSLFAAGTAGERFAVRNSGAVAVIEGSGDHCCEYMTGGVVVVLGRTGANFGAGFTGGFAYVLDLDRDFVDRYNHELVDIHHITPESMEAHLHHLRDLIAKHRQLTGSAWAREVLQEFRNLLPKFWVVKPKAAELGELIDSLRRAA